MKNNEVNVYDVAHNKLNDIATKISDISKELYHIQRALEDESVKTKNSKICGIMVTEGICEDIIMVRGQLNSAVLMLTQEMSNISNVIDICFTEQNLPWNNNNTETTSYVTSELE